MLSATPPSRISFVAEKLIGTDLPVPIVLDRRRHQIRDRVGNLFGEPEQLFISRDRRSGNDHQGCSE